MMTYLLIFTDLKTPIVSAPMGIAGIGAIARAVTAAGGFGFVQAGKLLTSLPSVDILLSLETPLFYLRIID